MKTKKMLRFMPFLLCLVLAACVSDDDYSIPETETEDPGITANTTIAEVKQMYSGALVNFDDDLIMDGYVVSNDEAGNFYKVLILQDKPENPTAAIQIDIDDPTLYDLYKPGRKVYVKLNGLGMTDMNGVLHIGVAEGTNNIARIHESAYTDYIVRSNEVVTLVPKVITPDQYSDTYINTLVQIDNMQLSEGELGSAYANEDNNDTVNRQLKNCDDESHTILRNSGFADFKSEPFPTGQGSIVAVFSKYNSDYQLFIRDTDDVMFDGERCGQNNNNPGEAFALPFSEDFEGQTSGPGEILNMENWGNVNVSGGTTLYEVRDFDDNKYAQITAFNSEESTVETWLVSPGLIIDNGTEAPILKFDTKDGYNNGDALSVHISTDYEGDVANASWTSLNPVLSTGNTDSYGDNFVNSGELDLSGYVGETIYVGFSYEGSDTVTTTFQIDNFYAGSSGGGTQTPSTLFEEEFETDFPTWTTHSITGAQVWEPNDFGNPGKCVEMNGYDDGNYENEDWLITPAIDLSGEDNALLTFQTAMNFTGPELEVFMATSYSGGNPNTDGNWTALNPSLSSGDWNWTDSGDLDVSSAAGGDLYVAFKYTSTTSASASWEVDNVKVFVP